MVHIEQTNKGLEYRGLSFEGDQRRLRVVFKQNLKAMMEMNYFPKIKSR